MPTFQRGDGMWLFLYSFCCVGSGLLLGALLTWWVM